MQAQRTLLLADDSLAIQKVVSLTFGDEGVRVLTVGSGAEALAQLAEVVPDAVLADVHMPAPNGYELCALIKRDERTRHVPVMLLVGMYELFDEAEARRVGADEVLTKPFQSIRGLVSKVSGMLGGHTAEKQAEEDGALSEPVAAPRAEASRAHEEARADFAPPRAESRAFAGFDLDDENIESATADEFSAREQSRGPSADAADEFSASVPAFAAAPAEASHASGEPTLAIDESPFALEEAAFAVEDAGGRAHDAAGQSQDAPGQSYEVAGQALEASGQTQEARGYAAAASASGVAGARAASPASFAARAPRGADDSLLDLEEFDAPPAPEDDFVLDIGDEPAPVAWRADSSALGTERASAAHEPRGVETGAVFSEAARAEMPASAGEWPSFEASHAAEAARHVEDSHPVDGWRAADGSRVTEDSSAAGESHAAEGSYAAEDSQVVGEWQGSQEISPANLSNAWNETEQFNVSPQADTEPVTEPVGTAPMLEAAEEAFAAPRVAFDSGAELGAHDAPTFEAAGPDAAHAASSMGAPETSGGQAGAAQLSQESIDAIARRVVEQLSESVVREIAWEVVPELAERLIRQRLAEEK